MSRAVLTSTGERIPARMLIVGIGVVPNAELAAAAGIATANGIRVDAQMRSSAPDILAIGDAASYRHWFTGGDVRLESVQNATDHAKLAARTITGHADSYSAVPWFWSDIGDMKLQMVGLTAGSDRQIVVRRARRQQILRVPLCRQQADRHRIGQSSGRPYAWPQDDGSGLFARRGDGDCGQRRAEGRARRMAGAAARASRLITIFVAIPRENRFPLFLELLRQLGLKVLPSFCRHGSGASKIQMARDRRDRRRRLGRARGHEGAAPARARAHADRAQRRGKAAAAETGR